MAKKKRNYKKSEPSAATTSAAPEASEFPSLGSPIAPPQSATTSAQPPAVEPTLPSTSQSSSSADPIPMASPPVDSPISEKSVSQGLATDIHKKLFVSKVPEKRPFPKRPGFLKIGSPLQLLTNHFLLNVGNKKAFHYDIEIERVVKAVKTDTNVVDKDVGEGDVTDKKGNKYTKKMATKLNRKIFEQMVRTATYSDGNRVFNGLNPVYDGQKNMFTSKKLLGTENRGVLRLTVNLNDEGRDANFYVNIKLTETNEEIDLNVLKLYHNGQTCDDEVLKKSVLFINTLLRHNSTMSWVPIGQSIFNPTDPGQKLGQYLLLSYGFYSSVRNLMVGPTLNIDRSAAAFYDSSITLQMLIAQIARTDLKNITASNLEESMRRKIKKELSGLQVEARHIQYGTSYRKYRILGITRQSAKDIKFKWIEKNREGEVVKNEDNVSVEQYFRRKYNRTLQYPNSPCLEVGNPNNVVKLPLEVCRLLPHQRLRRSMTNNERSEMTRSSGQQTPDQRLKMCSDFVDKQFHSGEMGQRNRPFLLEFEINVDKNLLKVDSKVIPPPSLKYGGQNARPVMPRDGEWEMFKSKASFLKAERLENWILINMSFTSSLQDKDIDQFCRELCEQAMEMGMHTEPPHTTAVIKDFRPKTTFSGIKKKINSFNPKIKMILFITPDKAHQYSDEIYSEIKLLGDVEIKGGLTTQCVNINSIWNKRDRRRKWNRSYFRQLILKINPKLGGVNVALLNSQQMPSIFKSKSVMIVGADVNHPAPADKISPSIAALVGSYDNEFSNYYTTVSMQPKSREEMIKYLDVMAVELLTNYQKKQNCLPQQIIFYRDGVSEGQFQHVIDNEYPLLTQAFTKMSPKYKPKLTFIVVQKRHHTRFMTADTKKNVPPGTVVETGITHKNDFDFYLCSHAGRIGTSRSAHYYVLADENGFNSEDMCKMTYYLCHIYQRCTKSVSIPAPVYYADLAAYRAKVHASYVNGSDSGSVISEDGGGDRSDELAIRSYRDMIRVSDTQKERLYFC